MRIPKHKLRPRLSIPLALSLLAIFTTSERTASAQITHQNKVSEQKEAPKQKKTSKRILPPKRKPKTEEVPFMPNPDFLPREEVERRKKNRGNWEKFLDVVAEYVPSPLRRGWRGIKKRWHRMVGFYRFMRRMFGEEPKERTRRLAKEKTQKVQSEWYDKDKHIERRIFKQLALQFHKRSCAAGSASSCVKWSRQQPNQVYPLHALRDIWIRRKQWYNLQFLCRHLIKRFPNDLENHFCQAKTLTALKRFQTANSIYQKMLKQDPKKGFYWLAYGQFLLQQKLYPLAEKACKSATLLIPKELQTWHCLGHALETKSQKQARNAYLKACKLGSTPSCRRVLALRPTGLKGMYWWSTTYTRMNTNRMSQAALRQSCRMGLGMSCRKLARQYRTKAKQLLSYKRTQQAGWWLQKATQVAPRNAVVWKEFGLYLLAQKRWYEARDALKNTLQLNPNQPLLWHRLAKTHQQIASSSTLNATNAFERACALGQHSACKNIKFPSN